MGNQNFVPKFPQTGGLGPNFAFLDEHFPTRRKVPSFFRQPKIAPPPRYDATPRALSTDNHRNVDTRAKLYPEVLLWLTTGNG